MKYHYFMTIQSVWGRELRAAATVDGCLEAQDFTDRAEAFKLVREWAIVAWRQRYKGVSADDFVVLNWDLSPNEL